MAIWVYRLPNTDSSVEVFRNIDVYREDNSLRAQAIYARNRQTFTARAAGENWNLYEEGGNGTEKWFVSYQAAHFDTNHGMPVWWDAYPDIYVGILKENVFVEVTYEAYTSRSNYIQTINGDIRLAADLLSRACSEERLRPKTKSSPRS